MKKENNQEFYVEQMDVHYPLQSEIQNEIEDIILKGMPQKISFLKRMKKIYLGPGLRVIYYKNLSVFFATFIIYFAVCLGLVLSFEEEIRQFGAAFLGMPVFFLLFSYFTCYMDEQTQINELRNTMYYSMNYIVSLRLFYTAVVLSLVNTSFYSLVGLGRKQSYRLELLEFQVCWSLRSLLYTFITDGITISALRVLVQYGYYFLQRSCDYRKQRFYFFLNIFH